MIIICPFILMMSVASKHQQGKAQKENGYIKNEDNA